MGKQATILIVDDSPSVLSMLTEVLISAGFAVSQAASGVQALADITEKAPDLILLDILMPDMDGFEVCRRLKSQAATSGIPVIFLTAVDNLKDKVEGFRAGAVDYVNKPFESMELLARVSTHLEVSRMSEELQASKARIAESNQLLSGVLEHTHMMAVSLDSRFNFIWVNRAYAATCRHEPSFFPGKNHFELYPHEENRAIFQRVVDTGEPFHITAKPFEFPDQPERGVTYWDWSLIPVKDELERVNGLVFTLADVTERKLAEQAQYAISARLDAILGSVPEIIMEVNNDKICIWANSAGLEFFGEDVVGREVSFCEGGEEIADRVKPLFNGNENLDYFECWQRRNDGEKRLLAWWRRLLKDAEGNAAGAISTARDITEHKLAEDALRLAHARLRSFVDANIIGVIIADSAGKIIEANDYYLNMIGYSRAEFEQGMIDWRAVTPAEWLTVDEQALRELREMGISMSYEKEYVRRDGARVLAFLSDAILPGSEGQIAAFALDITERKQMEKLQDFLARTSIRTEGAHFFEELAGYLAESLDMEFICIDRFGGDGLSDSTLAMWHAGKFVDNVKYALKDTLCGEMAGKTVCCFPEQVSELFPRDQVLQDLRAESYLGVTLWSHDSQPIGLITVIGHKPLKNRPQAEAMLKLVAVRAAGEVERLNAEAKLSQSEAEFRKLSMEFHGLLDAIPDSLMLLNRDLKILWVNKAAAETVGLTSENPDVQPCYTLWRDQMTACDACPVLKSFSTGEKENEIVTRPDGTIWDIRTVPLTNEQGTIENVIEVSRDITEQRKLEEQFRQSQKMESIGTLAGGIAHDFNNILTAIIGYGQISLMKVAADDPLRHNIESMLEAADRAAHLTRELLQFSRKQSIDKRPVDLGLVITKVEKFLKKVIGEDISFQSVLSESPVTVLADDHQLEQVLMNLAANARDAMPKGGILTVSTGTVTLDTVFISAHGYGKLGSYALITVTDTGEGMDETTRQRIFEPFFTTKETGKGTGLGLATAYSIIKQHEGYIDVYSEPGRGSTFRIYLPVIAPKDEEASPVQQEGAAVGGTETILLAEDDGSVRQLIMSVLTEFGYTVIEAVDGADAVSRFAENREVIDLLLFDLIMPKMNGKEALDQILKIRPGIKAIFSSGYAPETIRQKAALEEGVHLVAKPVSPVELLRKVRSVLDGVE